MTRYLLLSLVVLFFFTGVDCKKDIVDPPPDDIKPGRRDYVWAVDTLESSSSDLFTPTRIWGSSPNDVWATGFGSQSWNLLWHYDGIRWKKDSASRQISPSALWGTAGNNVWLGNSGGVFWRYDGVKWNKYSEHTLNDYADITIGNIWGSAENSIYGVGGADRSASGKSYRGVVMHFNGAQWQFLQIPDMRVGFTRIRQQRQTGLFFLEGMRYESTGDTSKIYLYDGVKIKDIYSHVNFANVEEVDGEIYIVIGKKIHKYVNGEITIWKDFSQSTMLGRMVGRSEKDFFTFTQEGLSQGIAHYNGNDLKTLFAIPAGFQISSVFILEKDLFVVCYSLNSNFSIAVRGTFQE
ncbi:MAG: hypothetical protein HYV29_04545 [Ignavibacteriales bacterium]|nr:hypothetical protein [Ignavibacteriales bacterium]